MKTAIIHDWLTGMRGGEKCLEVLCELYPRADLYTLLHIRGSVSATIERMTIKTSWLQRFPFKEKKYRYFLPFMPKAIESFDLSSYDLVISSSHCVAKGVITSPHTCHICYCHTPMRYAWDQYEQYFRDTGGLKKLCISRILTSLRRWDRETASRVDYFIANSANIASKIERYYQREAAVIYPPVDTALFTPSTDQKQDYLIVSAFAPYKRIDIAIEAFNKLGYPLKIVGTGQDGERLRSMANPNVEFLGWVGDEALKGYYAGCRALIFPGEEDFGIVPLEVQASGRPVIAFGKGGALETVIPVDTDTGENPGGATGVFFHEQTPAALVRAVKQFESIEDKLDREIIRKNALRFDRSVFKERIRSFITMQVHGSRVHG